MPRSLADLSADATAGEWLVDWDHWIQTSDGRLIADFPTSQTGKANAAFIVALVNAYRAADPELVARLERVREEGK